MNMKVFCTYVNKESNIWIAYIQNCMQKKKFENLCSKHLLQKKDNVNR